MTEPDPIAELVDAQQQEYADAAATRPTGPLEVEADAVLARLKTAVVVLTIDTNGQSHLVRASVVSVPVAADMLRSIAASLEAEEQAGEHQHP